MELYQMRYFCALVVHGQFAKAAQSLHIIPPTLTIAIKKLESELGIPLIDRTKQGFVLTSAGRDFYKSCSKILDAAEGLENDMRNIRDNRSSLTLFIEHSLNCRAINEYLEQFMTDNPDIDLHITWADRHHIKLSLLEREDALGVLPEGGPLPGLSTVPYGTCDLAVFFHREHPWEKLDAVPQHDLRDAGDDILNLSGDLLQDALAELGLDRSAPRLTIVTNDVLKLSIKKRFGIALLPASVADDEEELYARPLDPPLQMKYIFAHYEASPITPAMKKLMRFMRQYGR